MTAPLAPEAEGPPLLHREGAVATLTLRRPSRRNSIGDDDLAALRGHLAAIDADTAVRVVLLQAAPAGGARPVFSAGYDVGGFAQAADAGPAGFEQLCDAFEALRPVTVCALGGSVYGGATDLVLACDLRVARAGIEWRMPAAALGLHYYAGGLRRYVARLGVDAAKRAFLAGRALGVDELDRLGLFEAVVPAEAFDAAVDDLVRRVAALAPLAAQATKRSLNEIAAGRSDLAVLRGREAVTQGSADFAEGRAAFAERRPPRFTGR
jgi:enoyl-CoA hydratase/carnithine racemase